jgi:cation-transporting P-type ATPase F
MTATSQEISQQQQWHNLSATRVAQNLNTNIETGLTSDEVGKRRERYGTNELKGKSGTNPIFRFLLQFNQPYFIFC